MKKGKKILAATLLTTVFVTSTCSPKKISHDINLCSYVVGSEPLEVILPYSGEPVKAVRISGNQLEAGESYVFDEPMKLIIDGNVPKNTSITVANGSLEVTGDVGYKASLLVKVPSFTNKKFYPCVQLDAAGNSTHSTCSDIKELGPIPPYNNDAAITIGGKVDRTAKIESSYLAKVKIRNA